MVGDESPQLEPRTEHLGAVGQPVSVAVSPLFEALLNSARQLLAIGQHGAAVLIAQTAIEVCTERVIARSLQQGGAAFLRDWIHRRTRPTSFEGIPQQRNCMSS